MSAWTLSCDGSPIASGTDDIEGYMALWAHTAHAVQFEMENDRGMLSPVGRSYSARYTLALDGRDIAIDVPASDVIVLAMWIFGTGGGLYDFHIRRGLDNPKRDRLESFVRAYLRTGTLDAALKDIGVDYMRAIQDRED